MSTLPLEFISDLLCRLPVKSLLRFRCTSKHLCSVIDDPNFAKLHLKCSAQTSSHQSLIVTPNPICSLDLHSLERAVEIDHPLKTPQSKTQVIGCCNGLLCLINSDDEIVIWNKSTRKHHRLPNAEIVYSIESAADFHQIAYGFGYDSVHDDYKMVRIVRLCCTLGSQVMVYSLKSNSWKRLPGFPYEFLSLGSIGMLAGGALHWLVMEGGNWLVAAFDLAAEEFRVVRHPPGVLDSSHSVQVGWGVLESRFCVSLTRLAQRTDMWLLNHHDYGVEDSWVNLLSTSEARVTRSGTIMPIAYLPNGNELLLLQDCNNYKFLKYDLKRDKVKNSRIRGLPPNYFIAMPYVESLVRPFPMVKVVDETVGKRKSGKGKKNARKREGFLSAGFKLHL